MVHGDPKGLRLPPRIAPVQAVIVPIWRKDEERDQIAPLVGEVEASLHAAGIRMQTDWRDQVTPGFKFHDWELKGVPVRIEIGPRDVANGQIVTVRRDTREKTPVPVGESVPAVQSLLDAVQRSLFDDAKRFLDQHTSRAGSWQELERLLVDPGGFVWVNWCDTRPCEEALAGLKATVRAIPLDPAEAKPSGLCVCCGNEAQFRCIVARSY